jgi:IPT/TIG domain
VTITGSGFTGATRVVFGAVTAASFTVVSATKITAIAPAQAAGAHNVDVVTPSGSSALVAADMFTYTA